MPPDNEVFEPTTIARASFDPATDTYRAVYDWEHDDPLSAAVVDVVAAVTDREPEELPPLYDVVEPDALDAVLAPRPGSPTRREGRGCVTFAFGGCRVGVYWDGSITVSRGAADD